MGKMREKHLDFNFLNVALFPRLEKSIAQFNPLSLPITLLDVKFNVVIIWSNSFRVRL